MKSFGAKSFEVSQYLVKNGADMTEEERWIIAQVEEIRADVNAQDTEYATQPYAHAHGHSLMLFV